MRMDMALQRNTYVPREGGEFIPDASAMRRAIEAAREGITQGESPFGACVVLDGKVISTAHNRVWESTDITRHAEIVAISEACHRLSAIHLSGGVLYSICEPCPMCFAASHWADLDRIVYGAGISDALRLGFRELSISNRVMKNLGGSRIEITPGLLRDECLAVFEEWARRADRKTY